VDKMHPFYSKHCAEPYDTPIPPFHKNPPNPSADPPHETLKKAGFVQMAKILTPENGRLVS